MVKEESSSHIKTCFVFTAPNDLLSQAVATRQGTMAQPILSKLAERLRAEDFKVAQVQRGKPGDAALCDVKLRDFTLVAALGVTQSSGGIECSLLTWCLRPFWRHRRAGSVSEAWGDVCEVMHRILKQDLGVTALRRLTRDEAEAEWEQAATS